MRRQRGFWKTTDPITSFPQIQSADLGEGEDSVFYENLNFTLSLISAL